MKKTSKELPKGISRCLISAAGFAATWAILLALSQGDWHEFCESVGWTFDGASPFLFLARFPFVLLFYVSLLGLLGSAWRLAADRASRAGRNRRQDWP